MYSNALHELWQQLNHVSQEEVWFMMMMMMELCIWLIDISDRNVILNYWLAFKKKVQLHSQALLHPGLQRL